MKENRIKKIELKKIEHREKQKEVQWLFENFGKYNTGFGIECKRCGKKWKHTTIKNLKRHLNTEPLMTWGNV